MFIDINQTMFFISLIKKHIDPKLNTVQEVNNKLCSPKVQLVCKAAHSKQTLDRRTADGKVLD
jgi:hypothetical protein